MAAERYLLYSISIQLIAERGTNGALLHRAAPRAGLDLSREFIANSFENKLSTLNQFRLFLCRGIEGFD